MVHLAQKFKMRQKMVLTLHFGMIMNAALMVLLFKMYIKMLYKILQMHHLKYYQMKVIFHSQNLIKKSMNLKIIKKIFHITNLMEETGLR